jgi:predicted acyltransferase (DUF342 family)
MPLGPIALTTTTAALLVLPVAPALRELWTRRDATPLPTTRHDGRIANFAQALRSRLEPLRPQLAICCSRSELANANNEGIQVLLVGRENFDFHAGMVGGANAIMSAWPMAVPRGKVVDADVCTDSSLTIGEDSAVRAAMSGLDIILEKGSSALRWLHAARNVYLSAGSVAYGRLSADGSIYLEQGCSFQHIHATRILTAERFRPKPTPGMDSLLDRIPTNPEISVVSEGSSGDAISTSRRRLRVQGDFVLPNGEALTANIIATGEVRLGAGARVYGSVKAYRGVFAANGAHVYGSVVSRGAIRLASDCVVIGPMMAEDQIEIGSDCQIGESAALTTISSNEISIGLGGLVHGTIWARIRGIVEG